MDDGYQGPRLEDDLTSEFMKELLEWLRKEKKLHRKYAYKVHCVQALELEVLIHSVTNQHIFLTTSVDYFISARDCEESADLSGHINT